MITNGYSIISYAVLKMALVTHRWSLEQDRNTDRNVRSVISLKILSSQNHQSKGAEGK